MGFFDSLFQSHPNNNSQSSNPFQSFFNTLVSSFHQPKNVGDLVKGVVDATQAVNPITQGSAALGKIFPNNPVTGAVDAGNKLISDIAGNTVQSAIQAPVRAAVTLHGAQAIQPTGDVGKFLLGDQPIVNASEYAKQNVSNVGGLVGQKDLGKNLPGIAALPLGLALTLGDATPLGGGEVKTLEGLSKASSIDTVLNLINKDKSLAKLSDEAKTAIAPALVEARNVKDVRGVLDNAASAASNAAKDTAKAAEAAPPVENPGFFTQDHLNPNAVAQEAPKIPDLSPAESKAGQALGLTEDQMKATKAAQATDRLPLAPETQPGFFTQDHLNPNAEAQAVEKGVPIPDPIQAKGIFNRVKTWPENVKNAFADFVNERRAAPIEGAAIAQKFEPLRAEGLDAIKRVQAGDRSGALGEVANYYDSKFKELKNAGVDLGYQENYVNQIWKNTPEEINAAFNKAYEGKAIGLKPSFTLGRVVDDYETGIANGLTPKYDNLPDLLNSYEQGANKLLANKKFVDTLKASGYLQPEAKAPSHWTTIDPDRFPGGAGFKIDPAVGKVVNDYLRPANEHLAAVAGFASRLKNIVLSAGVPGTSINMFGLTSAVKRAFLDTNVVKGLATGAKEIIHVAADDKVPLEKVAYWTRRGASLGVEDHSILQAVEKERNNVLTKAGGKLSDWQNKLFENPLFQGALPKWKVDTLEQTTKKLIEQGFSKADAEKVAVKVANETYGGLNSEVIGRSKDFQNILRSLLLAPDFLETNVKTGVNVAKGLTTKLGDKEYAAYRKFTQNFVMGYLAANVLNKQLSGHWMYENQPGNKFNLEYGQPDAKGKQSYFPIFGSAADFLAVPTTVIEGIASGNTDIVAKAVRSRLSTPLGLAVSFASNTDYNGNPILGNDKYGKPQDAAKQASNVLATVGGATLPQQVQAPIKLAQGTLTPGQAAAQALEIPLRSKTTVAAAKARKGGTGKAKTGRKISISKGRKPAAGRKVRVAKAVRGKSAKIKAIKRRA